MYSIVHIVHTIVIPTQTKPNPKVKHNKNWQEIDRCDYQQRTAGLINIFVGWLGADQFYAGNYGFGVGKLLTLGGMGWWIFADIFMWASGGHYATKGCPV